MSSVPDVLNALLSKLDIRKSHSRSSSLRSNETQSVVESLVPYNDNCFNILIGCSGSVATVKILELVELMKMVALEGMQADVRVVITKSSEHFFSLEDLKKDTIVYTDKDEWSSWEQMGDEVLHIELRKWADVFVIAPCSANTLAKMANGLCNNLLTCTVRAWDHDKPLLFCPAMNTYMWDHPVTSMHLTLLETWGCHEVPCVLKKLACGETGLGGMASVETIVAHVTQELLAYFSKKNKDQKFFKVMNDQNFLSTVSSSDVLPSQSSESLSNTEFERTVAKSQLLIQEVQSLNEKDDLSTSQKGGKKERKTKSETDTFI